MDLLSTPDAIPSRVPTIDISDVLNQGRLNRAMVAPTSDDLVVAAVKVSRLSGLSWESIGQILGVSPEAAQLRYAHLVDEPAPEPHHPSGFDIAV